MKLVRTYFSKIDPHTLEVFMQSSVTMVVKILGMIAGFVTSIFLGRTIGAAGLGIINLSNQLAQLLTVFIRFGTPYVVVKEVAIGFERNNNQQISDIITSAFRINFPILLFVMAVVLPSTSFLANEVFESAELAFPLFVAFVVLLPRTITLILSSGLIGMRRIWQGNLANETLVNIFVGLSVCFLYLIEGGIDVDMVAVIYGASRVLVAVLVSIYGKKLGFFRKLVNNRVKDVLDVSKSLFLVTLASVVSVHGVSMIVSYFLEMSEVGLYNVALRIALLVSFFLQVASSAISPKIAAFFDAGKRAELQTMLQRVSFTLAGVGLVCMLIFVFFGREILSLWGREFREAYWVLVILGFGQFVNLCTGAASQLLIMSKNEKIQRNISLVFMSVNIIISCLLIVYFGIIGAAFATTVSVIGENTTRFVYAQKRTGIRIIPSFL